MFGTEPNFFNRRHPSSKVMISTGNAFSQYNKTEVPETEKQSIEV
jgi:hypothetical protein